jgi:hypothetical protein
LGSIMTYFQNLESVFSRTCGYCGMVLPSSVSLSLHQMVLDTTSSCGVCRENIEDDDERMSHVCQPEEVAEDAAEDDDPERRLLCPLGCPDTRYFDLTEMEAHLSILHGWEDDCNVAADGCLVEIDADSEMMAECPICHVSLNILSKSMLSHVFYQCNGRCRLLRETVNSLIDLSRVSRIV